MYDILENRMSGDSLGIGRFQVKVSRPCCKGVPSRRSFIERMVNK
jgi:hypothetical protein